MLNKTAIVAATVASVSYGVNMQAHTAVQNNLEATLAMRDQDGKVKDMEGNLFTDITWSLVESVVTEDMYDYICDTWGYCVPESFDETLGNASKAVLTALYNWAVGNETL